MKLGRFDQRGFVGQLYVVAIDLVVEAIVAGQVQVTAAVETYPHPFVAIERLRQRLPFIDQQYAGRHIQPLCGDLQVGFFGGLVD